MKSLVTTQHGQVLVANGEITVEINGERRLIASGEQLPVGATLFIPENAELEIAYEDGAIYSSQAAQSQISGTSDIDLSALDEIAAIQALIASGEDPTEGPETAAGAGTNGNEGGDFVSLGRSAEETQADSGFNTAAAPQSSFSVFNNESISSNDSPSIITNDSYTIEENGIATGNLLDNDFDNDTELTVDTFTVNGDTFTAGTEVELEGGTLVINEDGTFTFTPNDNWNGTLPDIIYTTNTGETGTVTIEVTPVDDPSILANDSNTVDEDTVATGNVLDNDSDIDNDLSVVSFEVNGETHTAGTTVELEGGKLVINADGSYTFTPNENWNGTVPVITYTTNTGSTATLTLEVTPVDDASILANDSNTVAEDTAATGNVLDNDSDIDNDLSVVSFEVDGDTYTAGTTVELEGGELVINEDGSYTFTPNDNWNGTLPVITYTTNTSSTATLTIEVTPVNDTPEFRSGNDAAGDAANVDAYDFGELNEGATSGTVVGTVIADDPDAGDSLSYSFEGGALTNGVFTINATTGVITLNQDIDDADLGTFNFNVVVTDTAGLTDIAAVTIDLNNVNEAPEFRSGIDVSGITGSVVTRAEFRSFIDVV
ncbi:MAG: retention module-containing protein [Shewanella sp.]|nr:retention module-containing protein [Shewanella sp.]